jgi:DNA modification methylase
MIINADCLKTLIEREEDSIDLVCTDPPYGYSFMGKDWDKAVPPVEIWQECLRVLKPGAFCFVMSAPRSDVQNAMISRLMEAGFNCAFTPLYHTYASGFPKSSNLGKRHKELKGAYAGYQPKPAVEVIIVAMKPLSEKTYVNQAMKNGKGVTWLDDARVPTESKLARPFNKANNDIYGKYQTFGNPVEPQGRFPANLLVSDNILGDYSKFFNLDTLPFIPVPKASKHEKNTGLDDFQEKQIKRHSGGEYKHNSGSTNSSKNGGASKNHHPTVKPLKLMLYLITLGSRKGDTVLDPFVGSGTTAVAAKILGRVPIGIEREAEYAEIARARLDNAKEYAKPVDNQVSLL